MSGWFIEFSIFLFRKFSYLQVAHGKHYVTNSVMLERLNLPKFEDRTAEWFVSARNVKLKWLSVSQIQNNRPDSNVNRN